MGFLLAWSGTLLSGRGYQTAEVIAIIIRHSNYEMEYLGSGILITALLKNSSPSTGIAEKLIS